ncbi:hypothetical protein GS399_17890 [Pedobacter sp. HMF7647]|uniref:FimB/Mfa2 family fimbrial subunit n=1 Tax=Hufsiella arboris TaxID=2695275 RepID=A0A7K1YFJ3_9SPHI|nr:hypothetical protein [Hufsiella arboris]MXV52848.1 hypothetical protein [Hufsiella arboris]
MKKILSLLVVCAMIAAACKKDSGKLENKPDETATVKKFPVSFKLSGFTSDVGTFPAQGVRKGQTVSDLSDDIKYLYCYVSKDNDSLKLFNMVKQSYSSDPDNFGLLLDTLPAGKYQVYLIGSNRSDVDVAFIEGEDPYLRPGVYLDFTKRPVTEDMGDNFYKKIYLTVNEAAVTNVTLNRFVGKVNVKALDAIPEGVSKVKVNFSTNEYSYNLNSGKGVNYPGGSQPVRTIEYIIKPEDVGKKDLTLSFYYWDGGGIELYTYNSAGDEIEEKFVSTGFKLAKNSIVTFSGKFFSIDQAFNINVNNQWGPETNQGFEYP